MTGRDDDALRDPPAHRPRGAGRSSLRMALHGLRLLAGGVRAEAPRAPARALAEATRAPAVRSPTRRARRRCARRGDEAAGGALVQSVAGPLGGSAWRPWSFMTRS